MALPRLRLVVTPPRSHRTVPKSLLQEKERFSFRPLWALLWLSAEALGTLITSESEESMSTNQFFSNSKSSPARRVQAWWFWVAVAMVSVAMAGTVTSTLAKEEITKGKRVSGAGKTIIEGGTGGTAP